MLNSPKIIFVLLNIAAILTLTMAGNPASLSENFKNQVYLSKDSNVISANNKEYKYQTGICFISQDSAIGLLSLMLADPKQKCPANDIEMHYMDSIVHTPGFQFFTEARKSGNMPNEDIRVISKLNAAFNNLPAKKRTRLDSLEIVTNFVYWIYPYDEPIPIASKNCDSIASLLYKGLLSGSCADITHFEAMILNQNFPWWGTAVELNSHTGISNECEVSHWFIGVADIDGIIYMVADPTINAVWFDSLSGKSISLDSAKLFLRDPKRAFRVVKRYSTYFGRYHSEPVDDGSMCEFTVMFTPGDTSTPLAYSVGWSSSKFIIRGPLRNFDYRDPIIGNPTHDYYWKKAGIPKSGWGWQDNLLFITQGICVDKTVGKKIFLHYQFHPF